MVRANFGTAGALAAVVMLMLARMYSLDGTVFHYRKAVFHGGLTLGVIGSTILYFPYIFLLR